MTCLRHTFRNTKRTGYGFVAAAFLTIQVVMGIMSGGVAKADSLPTGSLTAHAKVDADGNGYYEGADGKANTLGFLWGTNNITPATAMGGRASNLAAGRYDVSLLMPAGYVFQGWYVTSEEGRSCSNPNGTAYPVPVDIAEVAAEVTLCARFNPGTITIIADTQPDDAQNFTFEQDIDNSGTFELDDDADATLDNTQTFTKVVAGTYTVDQQPADGWKLANILCDGQNTATHYHGATINLSPGENVTCTFSNSKNDEPAVTETPTPITENATITMRKHIDTDGDGEIDIRNANGWQWELSDGTYHKSNETVSITPGEYTVSEMQQPGYHVTYSRCETAGAILPAFALDERTASASQRQTITAHAGDEITCTFVNTQDAASQITIIKDAQPDSSQDFEFSLTQAAPAYTCIEEAADEPCTEEDETGEPFATAILDDTGEADDGDEYGSSVTITDVPSGTIYIEEAYMEDWALTSISCHDENDFIGYTPLENGAALQVIPGKHLTCTFVNVGPQEETDQEAALVISKTNDQSEGAAIGGTITYTLQITNSGDYVYDAVVTDLPPEYFTYISGSWTASSSDPEHDVAADIIAASTEPTYGSPGNWYLGLLSPGEVVTLTYRVIIGDSVSPGSYPDLAFVKATSLRGGSVLGTCTGSCEDSVFARTNVNVVAATAIATATFTPQTIHKVVTTTELADTGADLSFWSLLAPLMILSAAYAVRYAGFTPKKGVRL